jgi:hypothetical protein
MSWTGPQDIAEPAHRAANQQGTGRPYASDELGPSPVRLIVARWPWLVAAAVLGGALGFLITGTNGYVATALMQLTQTDQDSLRIKQLGQTVERAGTSSVVVSEAARVSGVAAEDLAARLDVTWEEDTDIVAVAVRGQAPGGIVDQANAVAEAINAVAGRQAERQVEAIREAGNRTVMTGRLRDDGAEAARRAQLGAAIAAQQDRAAVAATPAVLLAPAIDADATGMPRPVGLGIGALAAMALGAGLALVVPSGHRRVRRPQDIDLYLPDVQVRSRETVAGEVAGLLTESPRSDFVVLALDDVGAVANLIGREVVELLHLHGVPAAFSTDSDVRGIEIATLHGVGWRRDARREKDVEVLVTVSRAQDSALSLLDGQASVLAVLVVKRGRHSVADLRRVTGRLKHAQPMVVLIR